MTLKAVLFDLGGTLLHYQDSREPDPRHPFRRVTMAGIGNIIGHLAANGHRLPPFEELGPVFDHHIGLAYRAAVSELRGGSIETPIRAALAEIGVEVDEGSWAELRPLLYRAVDEIVSPRQGLRETLTALQEAGFQMGIVSNTFWASDLHDRHLSRYDLMEFFPVRIYSCDMPFLKPHPAIFNTALERLGVLPEEAVYVGDRPDVDVAGAQKAGMRGVLIRSPYRLEEPDGVEPDAVINELPELPPLLQEWQGRPR